MAVDICTLESRYLDACKKEELLPNSTILSGFSKAKLRKSCGELCSLQIFLEKWKDVEVPALLDVFSGIDSSEIDTVDILHESPHVLNGELVLFLMRSINQKLRVVDLQDLSLGKDSLRLAKESIGGD